MSLFGAIIGAVGKVATTAYGVFKVALPILKAFEASIPEVTAGVDKFEELLAKGGVAGDDFCDRNLQTIVALEAASGRGVVVMGKLNELATKLRVYSQEQSPDILTTQELEDLAKSFYEFKDFASGWAPSLHAAIREIEAAE